VESAAAWQSGSMAANQPSGNPSSGGSPSSSGSSPRSSTPPGARPGTAPGPAAAGGQKRGRNRGSADRTVQTFRSPTALVVWVVWLLFAAANWVDLAVQGRDHTSAIAAALLLLATGFAYVTAQRPRIIADAAGITVRNPLRDHRIGWAGVTKVDVVDLLRVHCDWAPGSPADKKHTKVISSWAVHYSRRRQLTAEAKARRGSRPRRLSFGAPSGGRDLLGGGVASPPASTPEAEAEKIVRLLNERATAAQVETVWATSTVQIPDATPATDATPAADAAPAADASPVGAAAAMLGPTGWLEPLKSTWSRSALAAILIPALIVLIVCLL